MRAVRYRTKFGNCAETEANLAIDRTKNVQDRRVGRTHQLLFDALLELVQKKRYDKITVQEILDRANVGRSTFYAHFQDKDDLLTGNFASRAAEEFFAELDGLESVEALAVGGIVAPLLPLLQHAHDNRHLYEALRDNDGIRLVLEKVRESLEGIIGARVQELRPDLADIQQRVALHFLCEGAMATMLYWLEHEPNVAAEEIDAQLQRMMRAALESV